MDGQHINEVLQNNWNYLHLQDLSSLRSSGLPRTTWLQGIRAQTTAAKIAEQLLASPKFSYNLYQSLLLRRLEALLGSIGGQTWQRRICYQIQMMTCKQKRETKSVEGQKFSTRTMSMSRIIWNLTSSLKTSRLRGTLLFDFSFSSLQKILLHIICMGFFPQGQGYIIDLLFN